MIAEERRPLFGAPILPPLVPAHTRLYASTAWWTNQNTLEFYVAATTLVWGLWAVSWSVAEWVLLGRLLCEPCVYCVTRARFLPQWVMGAIALVGGTVHLLTPIDAVRLRMTSLFGAMMWWSALSLMVFVEVPWSSGLVVYGSVCVAIGICYLRMYVWYGQVFELKVFLAPVLWVIRRHWG